MTAGPTTHRWTRRGDLRDAWVLARTELRCRLRSLRSDWRRLAAVGFSLLFFGVVAPLVMLGVATDYGQALGSGDVPVGTTGVVFAAVGGLGLYFGTSTGFTQEGAGVVGPLVRTAVAPTAVSLGRLGTEGCQAIGLLAAPLLALLGEVAIGAGSPGPAVLLVAGGFPILLASLAVGRVVGAAGRHVNRAVGLSLWTKAALFVGASVAFYFAARVVLQSSIAGTGQASAFLPAAFLPGRPIQAYASVVLAPLGSSPRPLGIVLLALVLGTIPLGVALAVRLETRLLLEEQAADAGEETAGPTGSREVPAVFAITPSGRVAWRYLLRARRDPRMLSHLVPLLFGALPLAGNAVTDPESLVLVGPAAAVIGGATIAGEAFCLNPLGDDRSQLPLLLASTGSTAVLLRGRAIAGLVPGLAVAVGLGAPLALLAHGPVTVLAQSLFAVVLAVAATGTALGIGAAVPRFERREYMSVERPHPSMLAVIGFMFGGLLVGALGLVLVHWTVSDPSVLGAGIAWTVYLAVLALSGGGGYRYAVRRFDRLSLDDV